MSLPKYPKYIESGSAWLSEVPHEWEPWKISHAFDGIGSGTTPPSDDVAWYDEGTIPWVTTGELRESVVYQTSKSVTAAAVEKFSALRLHPAGSLAIAMYGATIGRLGILGVDATTNQACCVLSRPKNLDVRFVFYWLLGFKQILIDWYATGGGQPNINQDTIASLRIFAPRPEEQSVIAAFLDRETAKIDALIAEQEKLLTLLAEKRQATISHAVTKGLNPDVPMKDSGVEWLGEVPAHWELRRLKAISPQITVGIVVEPSKYYCDEGVPALRSLNVEPGRVNMESLVFISAEANEKLSKSRLNSGDLVAVRSGQVGVTAVVPQELDGCNCIDLIIIRKPLEDCEQFLCWFLGSDLAIRQFTEGAGGAIQQHFNIGTAMNLVIVRPPIDEQREVASFLHGESGRLDALTAEATRAVVLLKERRTALISAAVTGKIDVRNMRPEKETYHA